MTELNRTVNMLMAHPDNQPNSEFADRIDSLIELTKQLYIQGVRVSFLERKLKKAEQALNDIVKWDDELEDIWGDPGERANSALEHNASMDGF